MGKLAAGSLLHRVTFQKKTLTQDASGQVLDVWSNYVTVWANVKGFTGSGAINHEMQAGGTEVSRGRSSIRIRWREDITADMRVLHRGRIYDIRDVCPEWDTGEFVDIVVAIGASSG